MTEDACRLDQDERLLVENTIAEHCQIRGWTLYAVNCRSNHVHVVVAANRHPNHVREQFKAWCARRLKDRQRQHECRGTTASCAVASDAIRQNWWAERGVGIYINDDEALEGIIHYVLEGQNRPRRQ
jgi:REP element-mobilizing transposase RayT